MKKLKVCVVGAGQIGSVHIAKIFESNKFEMHSIISPSIEACAAGLCKDVMHFKNLSDSKSYPAPDCAIISSPNETHMEYIKYFAGSRIPILIEKPIVSSASEAAYLRTFLKNFDATILVGHQRRFCNIVRQVKTMLDKSIFGNINVVSCQSLYAKPKSYYSDKSWRVKESAGPLWVNAVHDIDLIRFLFGEFKTVTALGIKNRRDTFFHNSISVSFLLQNDIAGTLLVSDVSSSINSWENASCSALGLPTYRESAYLHFAGDHGCMTLPGKSYYINSNSNWTKKLDKKVKKTRTMNDYDTQLDHFHDVVRHNVQPVNTYQSALSNCFVVGSILKSMNTLRPVIVDH